MTLAEHADMLESSVTGLNEDEYLAKSESFPDSLTENCTDIKRNKAREILYKAFNSGYYPSDTEGTKIHQYQVGELIVAIEVALWNHYVLARADTKGYNAQLRSIKSNLADKKNPEFNEKVLLKKIKPEDLVNMPSLEMASNAKKRERERLKQDALEACQSDWELRNIKRQEGQFTCGKCKSRKTSYFQLQTRSSDEPMTTFVICSDCNNRWKF